MANPTVQKLINITEEAAPAVHIPVIVGNECIILTQQDVRRIEDVRLLSYSKLGANGQLQPIQVTPTLQTQCTSFGTGNTAIPSSPISTPMDLGTAFNNLDELLHHIGRQNPSAHKDVVIQEDEMDGRPPKATLSEQLKWSKACSTSHTYPLTYTAATSTTELRPCIHACTQRNDVERNRGCQTQQSRNCGTNTSEVFNDSTEEEPAGSTPLSESESEKTLSASKKKKRALKTHFLCI